MPLPQQNIMNNIADFFRPKATAQQQNQPAQQGNPNNQPQQNQQNQQRPQAPQGQQGQGNQQAQGQQGQQNLSTNNPEDHANPLDVYKDLFNNTPTQGNEPPKFALAPEMIGKAADSIDFMKDLPNEVRTKLQSGQVDPDTLSAIFNHVGRQAYSHAINHSSTLTDRFVGMRLGHEQQGLPNQVKKLLANNRLLANPKVANNPVIKAHMQMISEQLSAKFPDQSDEWIANKAQEYFTGMAEALTGAKAGEATPNPEDNLEFDWGGYIENKPAVKAA